MLVLLFMCLVAATSVAVAALVGPPGAGGLVVSAYVVAVGDVLILVEALSLIREVDRAHLLLVQGALASVAIALVVARRPAWPARAPVAALGRAAVRSPVLGVMALAVCVAWAYQALLALTVRANTWDALVYHLPRVASWLQHGGVYWIPNAPTDRLNEFQPGAEELVLSLAVVAGDMWPYAIPQLLAGCALIAATCVSARALGFSREAAVFAALVAATLPMVVLQATTAQNDLIAAALVGCAVALTLRGGTRSLAIAGIAVGLAMAVKLTVVLAAPILVGLALTWGWRGLRTFSVAAVVPALTVGAAGIWRNLEHTDHPLGNGGGRLEHESDGSLGSTLLTSYRIGYRLLDISGLNRFLHLAVALGIVAGGAVYVMLRRRGAAPQRALGMAILAAVPLLAPVLYSALTGWARWAAEAGGLDVNADGATSSTFFWVMQSGANEDLSYFGVVGGGLFLACLIAVPLGLTGRIPRRAVILALSLPVFIVLLSLQSAYNAWLGRFLLVPFAIAVPLVAYVWAHPPVRATVALVSLLTLIGTSLDNSRKPFDSSPWSGGWKKAISNSVEGVRLARSTAELESGLAGVRCVVAVVGENDPSLLVFGPHLERHVTYLDPAAAASVAVPVVLGPRVEGSLLRRAGWSVERSRGTWRIAWPPGAADGGLEEPARCPGA